MKIGIIGKGNLTTMVKEEKIDDRIVYICELCGFGYVERKIADQCEEWCRTTGICSIAITNTAVYFPNPFEGDFEKR